ncbi:hypothetical protein MMC07_006852 [Pseudocyphellaria aurata]|nr:hypothetical protein [Pseudocyphellaria aurata]
MGLGVKRNLFRRCVQCDNERPGCPQCATDETCQLIGASCEECAKTVCTKVGGGSSPSATPSSSSKGGAPVTGAIAGGVVGGVAVIVIVTWLVWRFCIKPRREDFDENEWRNSETIKEKEDAEFTAQRHPRASTHTVGSIASTVLTRASDVIQIAYIPGVTNRSLVPPVPPIPAASLTNSTSSTPQPGQEQHFFMPSDLRNSRWSGYTDDNRTSYARSSLNPTARSSVATTAYRNDAVVNPLPAQVIARGKANAVSVKSSGKNSPVDTPRSITPPMPPIEYDRHGQIAVKTSAPIVARLGVPKAVTLTKSQPQNAVISNPSATSSSKSSVSHTQVSQSPLAPGEQPARTPESPRHNGEMTTFDDASTDDDDTPPEESLMGHNRRLSASKQPAFKSPQSAPDLRHSPYHSSSSSSVESQNRLGPGDARKPHKRSGSLNQIIEEATRRASREPRHGGLGSRAGGGGAGVPAVGSLASWRKDGPFSDANAAQTP